MMDYWQDKVVLVTGGSAGLGKQLATAFCRRKARLVIAARSEERLLRTQQQLQEYGHDVTALPADVTRVADVQQLIERTLQTYGQLDALVNCVGRSIRRAVLDTTVDDFDDLMRTNFYAVVHCTQAAMPHLVKTRGHIVNIGSLASKTASPFLGAYATSKFALAAYSQQLRLEGPPEVHVLLVCPGPILRDDSGQRYNEQARDLPDSARQPGGGAKLKGIPAEKLARKILIACERRQPELVLPAKARVLFAISQLWPSLGDWILRKQT